MTTVWLAPSVPRARIDPLGRKPSRPGWMFASESLSSVLGFLTLMLQARRLGPASFATLEYATAVSAWMLVVVRGGVDQIVYREAARCPRLVARFTNLLIGIRLASVALAMVVVLGMALLAGFERGSWLGMVSAILIVSALTPDIGLRARGLYGCLALAQGVRSTGYLAFVCILVRGSGDLTFACLSVIFAEVLSMLMTLIPHMFLWSLPKPTFRSRSWRILIHRGTIAGMTRFGRVTLYGLDLLVLGSLASAELGTYAAARRVVYALVALGIVVPAALGPQMARAWLSGRWMARRMVGDSLEGSLAIAMPASLGIILTADRWMPAVFGVEYREGGPWLALVVARLPWLLVATLAQAVLVACRKEAEALRLVVAMLAFSCVAMPIGYTILGAWGIGVAFVLIEAFGAIGGVWTLARLGVAPAWLPIFRPIAAGCLGLTAACRFAHSAPLVMTCFAGAFAYGSIWWLFRGGTSIAGHADDR